MKTINIETIIFDSREKLGETENYPNSGFFIAKTKNNVSDLVMIDKKAKHTIFVCPETTLENLFENVAANKPIELEAIIQNNNKYDGDFILEFSKILLNRK